MIDRAVAQATELNKLALTYTQLSIDAQMVVAMRLMGMSGAWQVPQSESGDMVSEKMPAFTEAILSGALAALSGRDPTKVMQATLGPLSEKAKSNRTRLARHGPRSFSLSNGWAGGMLRH